MEISHIGHSCFKVVGKNLTVVIDPYNPKLGLKMPKLDADVLILTHDHFDHNYKEAIKGDYLLLDSPGEYEVRESFFQGITSFHDDKEGKEWGTNTIFTMEIDGVRLCHLGDLGTELSSEQLEAMDGVDILMVPVGGTYTIDAKTAVKVINDVSPKIVIPMHYKTAGSTKDDIASLDKFLGEIGEEPDTLEKLKIMKKDLPEEMKVVVLKS
ncbi:MAG: MBL fold metallo-hydrolase [Patescibacteria group bacterium]